MRKLITTALVSALFYSGAFSQSTTCPWVNAGPDVTICTPNCTTLGATFLQTKQTTSYTGAVIPYAPDPFNAGTALSLFDDQWSPVVNIGFTFCFFGVQYTQCIIGSNGEIGFNLANASAYNTWPISASVPTNTVADLTNTIMGPWQDIQPPVGGTIKYQTYGSAPCRRFVVSWLNTPMYSCGTPCSQQITLYETTNIIDNFLQVKPLCSGWNGGYGIQGLQNAAGTVAYVVPGRNYPTQWTATNDAWRWSPAGANTFSFSWWANSVQISTNPTLSVCPTTTTTYTAQVVYTNCDNTQVTVTDPMTVTVSSLTVTPSAPATICNGGTASISATAPGAISWSWAPATGLSCPTCQTTNASPTTTTTYTCYVSNGTCQGQTTVTVTVNPLPTITVTPSAPSYCAGGSVVLTAGGANTYVWSPATGLSSTTGSVVTASPTATTTYTVTGTSASGCTGTTTVTVTVLPRPTITVTPAAPTICAGGSVGLTASGANSYVWTPSTGLSCNNCPNPTASPTATTTYTVTGTALNGCTNTATVTVTVTPLPTISVTPASPSYCAGGSTVLTASGATTYVWSPGTGLSCTTCASPTANPTATTTYTVTGTGAGGCTATTTVTVTVLPRPTITVTPAAPSICAGGSVGLTASGASTYAWTPATGLSCTNCPNPTASPTATTTYTVTGTGVNGCTNTATVTVTVNPNPTITVIPANPAICPGGNIALTASGATTYVWTPATGLSCTTCANPTASPTATTTYTVTGTNAFGCTGTTTVTVTVNSSLIVNVSPSNPNICIGGNVVLTASNAVSYVWSPATGLSCTTCASPTASPTTTTTYTVTGTNAAGCTGTATVTVTVNPNPTVTIVPANPAICVGGNVVLTASGATTYVWSPATGLSCTTCANPTASPTTSTTYTVTGTNAFGCTGTATVTVTVNPVPVISVTPATPTICSGTTVNLTASGASTYVWSPGTGLSCTTCANPVAFPTVTTTYTVTGTAVGGCTGTTTVTVTVNNSATLVMSMTPVLCNGGNTGTATVVASGGNSPYTYLWNPSLQNTSTATGLSAGTYTVTVTTANGCTSTATIVVTQPTLLNASTTVTPVLCNGGTTGTSTVTASGGTGPYTYNWAPSGQTTATATGLSAGTYTVTVTDANGCTRTATSVITQPTLLNATTSQTPSNCGSPTGTATVNASGGTGPYTYLWTPSGQTTVTATGLTAGTYTVTVTDANGCTGTATIVVNNNAAGVASISTSTNVSCFGGSNGSATSTITGGTGPFSYLWTPTGQTTATATGLSAGTYSVVITDANGCSATANVTITQPTQVTVTTTVPIMVACNGGNTGSVTATGAGGTGVITYLWTPTGQTTGTATGLTAGTYTVVVTDANGCTAQTTVVITQPTLLAVTTTQVNVLCNGGNNATATANPTGGVSPYVYNWSPSGQTTQTATGLTAGTYTVTVTDANGCTRTATVTITQPTALALTTSTVQAICGNPNGTATVNATGGTAPYSYLWNNGQTTSTATGLSANTYTVVVTDGNGCTATATVTVVNAGSPTATITSWLNVTCFGGNNGTATVGGSGGTAPYTYLWTPTGQTTNTATGLIAGTYTATVTDANGCSATATVTITEPPLLTATMGTPVNVLCNGNLTGSATVTAGGGTTPYSYVWSNGQTNATATGLGAGNYTVTITDANLCTASATVTITQPTLLVTTATGSNATCNGVCNGTAGCNPSGGTAPYTYLWTPGNSTAQNIINLCPGVYTVVITDANGCTVSDTAQVAQPTLIVLTTTSNTAHCNQADGDATVTTTGGTPGYTVLWNNGQTTTTATGLAPNTYTVVVTDANGCTMSATVVVPNTPGVVASITASTNVSCFGSCNGTATATATGGVAPYTYLWTTNPAQSTAVATGLCAGTYVCQITDASGCTDTASITITQPQILSMNPISPVTICNGQSTTLVATAIGGTPAYVFVWMPGNMTGSSVTVSPTVTTTYTVQVTDANGCTDAPHLVTVTVNPALNVVANGTTAICIGASTSVSAAASGGNGGPYTYTWMPGNMTTTSATVSPTVTTTYTVTVNDNCTTTPATATVTITVNPLPIITFTTQPSPAEGCAPLCVNFVSTTPNSAQCDWNFTVGTASNNCNPQFCFGTPGSYDVTLTVTDNNGCVNSLVMPSMVTVWPNPVADFTMSPQPTTVLNGTINFTDQSTLANAWSWEFGDVANSTSSLQNPTFTYTDTGYFPVILWVTTIHGCIDSALQYVRIDPEMAFYMPNAFTPNNDGKNDIFIPVGTLISNEDYQFMIFDRWGAMIFNTDNVNKGWDGRANDGNDVAQQDVYVWKVILRDDQGNKKQYVGHVSLIR